MLLSIKLGSCVTMRDKAFLRALRDTLRNCNRAKNAAVRDWFIQHDPSDGLPQKMEWNKRHYHAARAVSRSTNSNVVSSCCQHARVAIKARMPYTVRNGSGQPPKYKWQAILLGDISLPSFCGRSFPLPVSSYRIGWEGLSCGKGGAIESKGTCVLSLPLFSRESGRHQLTSVVRLLVSDLSAGHKRILYRLLDPDDSLVPCDALIAERDGKWYLRLPYKDTEKPLAKLNVEPGDRVVTILPNDFRQKNPFCVVLPDGRKRYLGMGVAFQRERERVEQRRVALNVKYRHSGSGKGHGRKRYFQKSRPVTRYWECFTDRIEKILIADIVKLVRDTESTGVVYREPNMHLRKYDWFGKKGLPWAWSDWRLELEAKLLAERIGFKADRIKRDEYDRMWNIERPKKKKTATS